METLFAQLPGWLERTPSFATAIAIALAYALSTRARKSDPLYTSSVVNLLSAAACITISAVVAGVFSGWEWRGMQHAGVGALAAVAFAVGDSADMSLVVTTVSIVLLFADYTTGAPMERLRAAARFAQPLVVGTSAFLLSNAAFGKTGSAILRNLLVGAVFASQLSSPVEALQGPLALAAAALLVTAVLFVATGLTPMRRGLPWVEALLAPLLLLSTTLVAVVSTPLRSVLTGGALTVLAGYAALSSVRARAPVFAAAEHARGFALQALLLVLTTLAVAAASPSSPSSASCPVDGLLSFATGYAAATVLTSMQFVLLEPLQLYAAAACRASTLDYVALETILAVGFVVLATQSTRPVEAFAWAGKAWQAQGGAALAAQLKNHPALAFTGLPSWTPVMYTALTACAVFLVACALQSALSASTLLSAPLVGEVTARGTPRYHSVALTYALSSGVEGMDAVLAVLAKHGCKATFFLPLTLAQSESGRAFLTAAVRGGHEVGLLGEVGGGGVKEAASQLSVLLKACAPTPAPSPKAGTAPAPAPAPPAPASTRLSRTGVPMVDTEGSMVRMAGGPGEGGDGGASTGLAWYAPPDGSRDASTIRSANEAGLAVALWSAITDDDRPASLLADQLQAEKNDIAERTRDRTAGAVVRVGGKAACSAGRTEEVCALLALRRGGPGGAQPPAVVSLSTLCPNGGRINEVLRVGGAGTGAH